jgi:hypothetical protein
MSTELLQDVLVDRVRVRGPLLAVCPVPGCSTLTMGGTCVEHDPPVKTTFPRGRPFVGKSTPLAEPFSVVGDGRPGSPG